jgi:hypothetical protein
MIKNIKPINKLNVEYESGAEVIFGIGSKIRVNLNNGEILIGELCWTDETAFFIKRGEREIETEIDFKDVCDIDSLENFYS